MLSKRTVTTKFYFTRSTLYKSKHIQDNTATTRELFSMDFSDRTNRRLCFLDTVNKTLKTGVSRIRKVPPAYRSPERTLLHTSVFTVFIFHKKPSLPFVSTQLTFVNSSEINQKLYNKSSL